ncbi:hypothetical protein N7470_001221 [Penicillium chermesinum]|nr:hypothetical protein N7470_001221 [Penicillium chermesinum]
MALLSGPLLRGSLRRTPDDHSDIDGHAPPMKRQRTQFEHRPRRRRSSPDCLTTTQDIPPVAAKVRPANPPLEGGATAHFDAARSSTIQLFCRHHRTRGPSDSETPSILDRLRDARESPDPLDTISPVASTTGPKARPKQPSQALGADVKPLESPTARPPRRRDTISKTELASLGTDDSNASQLEQPLLRSPARPTRSQHTKGQEVTEAEPAAPSGGLERRSLRSTDSGSRCKSELAQYFYNYEQIISLEQAQPIETLAGNTTIILADDLSEPLPLPSNPNPTPFGNPLLNLHDCESIELPISKSQPAVDPLGDELYFKAHRKFERQEKQLRNIERDRAQHEKQALERLLEELRSPEWLRVMGLVGVHESDKKLYEPKRQILIQELVVLVNKFQAWKDEEKRRRLMKEKPHAATDAEQESRRSQTPSTPDPSDVDAWAARQLHQEARSASGAKLNKPFSSAQKAKPKAPGPSSVEKRTPKTQKPPAKQQKTLDAFLSRAVDPSPPPPPPAEVEDDMQWEGRPAAIEQADQSETTLESGYYIPEPEEREYAPPMLSKYERIPLYDFVKVRLGPDEFTYATAPKSCSVATMNAFAPHPSSPLAEVLSCCLLRMDCPPDLPWFLAAVILQYLIPSLVLLKTRKVAILRYLTVPYMIWIMALFCYQVEDASITRIIAVSTLGGQAGLGLVLLLINPLDENAIARDTPDHLNRGHGRYCRTLQLFSFSRAVHTLRQVKGIPFQPAYFARYGSTIPRARWLIRQSIIFVL